MFIRKLPVLILTVFMISVSAFFVGRAVLGIGTISGRNDHDLLEKRLRIIFIKCNTAKTRTLSSQNFKCLAEGLSPLLTKENLGTLMEALVALYSKEPSTDVLGIASCHLPAHLIGSKAIERGLTFNEVFKACGPRCSYGCVHGAYSQNFSKDPNFLGDFTNTCKKYLENPTTEDLHSCFHITGHWLGEMLRNDVDTAIEDCMKFPDESGGKDYCISGLRMELLVGSPPKNISKTILNDYTTEEFCKKFPEKYHAECFSESGFYVYRAFADTARTIENCNQIPQVYAKACAQSAGVAYYFSSKDNAERVVSFCKAFGENEKECIYGALEISVSESNFYPTAIAICNLEEDFSKECFAAIGSKALELNGREFKEKICGALNGVEKLACEESGGI